ncbi:MAG: DUF523 domain-containing protein [Anaerolineae bacterium]|jgi:uncharacterized protein YbbK (DUF523 family)
MPEIYLVSACLLGIRTTYDDSSHPQPRLIALAARGRVVPVCPEVAGGLSIPRPPAEIIGGDGRAVLDGQARVLTCDDDDVTEAFIVGARVALETAQRLGIKAAVMQPRSPSCGHCQIYDGSFSGRLIAGQGVAAALLTRHGVGVVSPEELEI